MAAGGFKEFVAGETLDQDEINDYLMQGVLVFAGTAARGSAITAPVEGQFAFLKDSDTLTFHDGSDWVPFESGLTWATIGTAATGSYNDGTYDWNYWDFTSNGSLVIDEAGLLDILVVGSGSGGRTSAESELAGGGAGGVRFGIFEVSAGTVTVTIGAGGAGASGNGLGNAGNPSSFGSILQAGGGGQVFTTAANTNWGLAGIGGGGSPGGVNDNLGGFEREGGGAGGTLYGSNLYDGISLSYTGSSIEFGRGGTNGVTPAANSGGGGASNSGTGADGRVVVRVRA